MERTITRTHKTYVTVDAEVSLDEFDEDALVEYLQSLGYHVSKNGDASLSAMSVYEAMKTRRPGIEALIEQFVCEVAGRVTL